MKKILLLLIITYQLSIINSSAQSIAAGVLQHSLALCSDSTARAWGLNNAGQLGNGNNTDSNVPVQVTGLCQILTGVQEENSTSSLNIFPNPASYSMSVSFFLFQSQKVSLKIFDVNGRLVTTLADASYEEGDYEITWNAAEVNSGIYFLRMEAGDYSVTEKLSVIK